MTNYILKNNNKENNILLYEEKKSYSFIPKKGYKWVKKVTILDSDMLNKVWNNKISREYNNLIRLIYELVSSEDTSSDDVLVAYTEIERIKSYLLQLEEKGLEQELLEKYMNKLCMLEHELNKVHVLDFTEEIEMGKGR